jgi:4-amino-4-deoxy-L-arabinose transferase-like glycosyltransferase
MPGKFTNLVRRLSPGATLAWAEGLVLVLCLFNVSYRIDTSKIGEWDEARYGVSAFEMLVTKDLWVNTYAYERDFANLKPPLGLWAIGASYALVGVTPLGLRLPSMLAGVLCVWVTIRLGRRVGGPPTGVLAGAILATTFPFILRHGARTGNFDVLLTLLITLALWLTSAWPRRPATAWLLGLVFASGFLVKSWAVGPFILGALLYILATQGRAALGATIPSVSVACLLPIMCWASVRGMRDGPEFLQRMGTYDLLHRATDTRESADAFLLCGLPRGPVCSVGRTPGHRDDRPSGQTSRPGAPVHGCSCREERPAPVSLLERDALSPAVTRRHPVPLV